MSGAARKPPPREESAHTRSSPAGWGGTNGASWKRCARAGTGAHGAVGSECVGCRSANVSCV